MPVAIEVSTERTLTELGHFKGSMETQLERVNTKLEASNVIAGSTESRVISIDNKVSISNDLLTSIDSKIEQSDLDLTVVENNTHNTVVTIAASNAILSNIVSFLEAIYIQQRQDSLLLSAPLIHLRGITNANHPFQSIQLTQTTGLGRYVPTRVQLLARVYLASGAVLYNGPVAFNRFYAEDEYAYLKQNEPVKLHLTDLGSGSSGGR